MVEGRESCSVLVTFILRPTNMQLSFETTEDHYSLFPKGKPLPTFDFHANCIILFLAREEGGGGVFTMMLVGVVVMSLTLASLQCRYGARPAAFNDQSVSLLAPTARRCDVRCAVRARTIL